MHRITDSITGQVNVPPRLSHLAKSVGARGAIIEAGEARLEVWGRQNWSRGGARNGTQTLVSLSSR